MSGGAGGRLGRRVVLLAGGTGGAKLAVGLEQALEPGALTVIANPGDDCDVWGLRVCPDLDAVLFRLAGIFNQASGFGVAGDTFSTHGMMSRLGEPDWFWLGDRDLALHILRTSLLQQGLRLSQVGLELGRRLGVQSRVIPVTDDQVRTRFTTSAGELDFQEYFVRERLAPRLLGVRFVGLETARPSPEALDAVRGADLVVIGPSNPVISIAPLISVLKGHLRPQTCLAISPIVGGRALKGPTVEMMSALGLEPTPLGVAREYRGVAGWYVLDRLDQELEAQIRGLGFKVLITDTVMEDDMASQRLAEHVLGGLGAA
ncbi:MAG TPA: 2-phospho-L-lactate transferase [Candidatus Nitrosotalea sp.]|nr:2-phospho-L-lactate transferase [Candidatus Nitrosotalea sp.]